MPEITEAYMLVGLGFLAAAFVVILILPFVWRSAVARTTRRIQGKTHITLDELKVDKEKLRSELSVTARQLDIAVEEWQDRAAMRLMEIGRTNDDCNAVLAEVNTREETVNALEAELAHVRRDIADIRDTVNGHIYALTKQGTGLADQRAKYEEITKLLNEVSSIADERKIEIVAMRTQITNLNNRIEELRKDQSNMAGDRHALKGKLGDAKAELAAANTQIQKLEFAVKQREGTIEKFKAQIDKRKLEHDKRNEEMIKQIEQLRAEKSEMKKAGNDMLQNFEAELGKERATNKQLREEMTNIATKVANLAPPAETHRAMFGRVPFERDGVAAKLNGGRFGASRQRRKAVANIERLSGELKNGEGKAGESKLGEEPAAS